VGWRRQGDAMAIITCVTTPHKGIDFTVNYVWHLLEGVSPNACPFKHSSLASAVAAQTASPKLPIFGVFGVRPSAAKHCPSGKGRSRRPQMTAGTPDRRALTGADARHPFEGRPRPPVTPQVCPQSPSPRHGSLGHGEGGIKVHTHLLESRGRNF
jgi:hypothetical protein